MILATRQCVHCILDSNDDPQISLDEHGVCNHCREYKKKEQQHLSQVKDQQNLNAAIKRIRDHTHKKYNCILGLSGGTDSSYLALKAHAFGLKPLIVHFDNGWNSELAVKNIEHIVDKLNLDLFTLVVDWEEFRDLQLAFIKASVVDIEMVTDHAIIATMYKLAIENDIKYIISGTNFVTEQILPRHWIHDKRDHVHIKAINKIFSGKPLKTYPLYDSKLKMKVVWAGIESIALLDYMEYDKEKAKEELQEKLSWRDYGGKHYESIFTRFYQGYILPQKFGIDKRKAHLSNLICSGQITREEALIEMKKPVYDTALLKSDFEFVLKKFDLTRSQFEELMSLPVKKHSDYPIETMIYDRVPALKVLLPVWRFMKKIKHNS
jgi:N-acetyl sugar amidotransferase